MNYPLVLVVGPSGSGKSHSVQNLPIESTVVINTERKFLPFSEASKFAQVFPKTVQEIENEMTKALTVPETKHIVFDSISKYFETLLDFSRQTQKGYDIYNLYNAKIYKFLEGIKESRDKMVYILGIDERVEFVGPDGGTTTSRRLKVGGKQWEGLVEKEFTVVLFTDVKAEKGKGSTYGFVTNNDGTSSAKSPEGMFDRTITNDLAFVGNKIKMFYGLK